MRWFNSAKFSEKGSDSIPVERDYVAVGIAANSEVDVCKVGGVMLAPGRIVPFSPTVEAVRGLRGNDTLPSGAAAIAIGQNLALQLYERCDPLIAPGPRSPVVVVSDFVTIPAAFGAADPVLRVPFAGRTQAAISIKRTQATEAAAGYTVIVRGVRYAQKIVVDKAGDAGAGGINSFFSEVQTTQVATVSVANPGSGNLAKIFYVGGNGDAEEAFDELEVYVASATPGLIYLQAEASGERGI